MTKSLLVVSGGAGHVGSHVVEMLVARPGTRVISVDNYSTGRVENHVPGAEYRVGDTRDIAKIVPEKVDRFFHLGEYARIDISRSEPRKVYESNILGTFSVAEFCWQRNIPLVYAGSSTKFADNGDGRSKNPYAFTKATNVDLINNARDWYGLRSVICYFNNAFGPRETGTGPYATLIAKFQQAYLHGEPLTIVGTGEQKRNFTHVRDLALGMIMAGEQGGGDGYVLGHPKAYSVLEIAKAFGGSIKYIEGNPGRAESGTSPTRARDELGWKPTVDVMDFIKEFVAANPRPNKSSLPGSLPK